MRITIHQIQVFKCVAEVQSVSLAAKSLHMTQPAVSNILRQIEDYYQCTVVQVINRKLQLTEFGKVLLKMATEMDELLVKYKEKIHLMKGLVTGNLNVATTTTAKYFMPHFLGQFKKKYPKTHINMKVYHRELILERLEKNIDDFVVLSQLPDFLKVNAYPILQDQLVVAASYNHPLASDTGIISLEKLNKENWIIREMGSGTRMAMINFFKEKKFIPNIDMELGNNEAIKQALIADLGISVVSHYSIRQELEHNLLAILDVEGFPLSHTWYYVTLENKMLSPMAEKFLSIFELKEMISSQKALSEKLILLKSSEVHEN